MTSVPGIASIVPRKWPHFQESPKLCHLLHHHVPPIQNREIGPEIWPFQRLWHDSGHSWEMTSFSRNCPRPKSWKFGPTLWFCIRRTWRSRRWHNSDDSWKWRHFPGTIEAISGNGIFQEFLATTSCSIIYSWYKIGKSDQKFGRYLENSNVIVYPQLCPPPVLLPYHFRKLK